MKNTIFSILFSVLTIGFYSCDTGTLPKSNAEEQTQVSQPAQEDKPAVVQDDGKLSRSKAEEILRTKYPLSIWDFVHYQNDGGGWQYDLAIFKKLEEKGWVTFSMVQRNVNNEPRDVGFVGSITEEGMRYFGSTNGYNMSLEVAQWGLGEITGILEDPANNSASVEYTRSVSVITPVGEVLGSKYQIGQSEARKAKFVKFDDGWRLDGENF
ncbi:MAG: hypothetical protein Q8M15_02115 [Bacteroidota bacterium]|nr:hypothetical protein [Bacteroidota bacterium]